MCLWLCLSVWVCRHSKRKMSWTPNYYNCYIAHCPGPYWWSKVTFTHTHLSWSSNILYQLPPSNMIHSILPIQFICLKIFLHNLSPSPEGRKMVVCVCMHAWQCARVHACVCACLCVFLMPKRRQHLATLERFLSGFQSGPAEQWPPSPYKLTKRGP